MSTLKNNPVLIAVLGLVCGLWGAYMLHALYGFSWISLVFLALVGFGGTVAFVYWMGDREERES